MEVDVVCVGSGVAAGTAAVTARSQGAKVAVLEKMPLLGGTTSKSGGVAWIPNNSLLRARGAQDPREDCLRYLARYAFPQIYSPTSPALGLPERDFKLIEAFYDQGSRAIDHLQSVGAVEFREFKLPGDGEYPADYADMPENKVRGRAVEPAAAPGPDQGGGTLVELLAKWLQAHDVPLLTEHHVTAVVKAESRVIGVEAQHGGKKLRIRARRGVVFGSGGYAHNTELIGLHQTALVGSCAMPGSTGDFIAIATAAGARMGSLQTAWRTQVLFEEALENRALGWPCFILPGDSMIVVNKYGRRIANEKRNYNDRTRSHLVYDGQRVEYPNLLQFMVLDARSVDAFGGAFPIPNDLRESRFLIQGETLAELSSKIAERLSKIEDRTGGVRLAADFRSNLEASVSRFNGYAKTGRDIEFNRGVDQFDIDSHMMFSVRREGTKYPENRMPNLTMHPLALEGPYYAFILGAGALDTNGGPMINERGEVLDAHNAVIPGLYGAGNCIASPLREAYVGPGGTIGLALTFGYIAGMSAGGTQVAE